MLVEKPELECVEPTSVRDTATASAGTGPDQGRGQPFISWEGQRVTDLRTWPKVRSLISLPVKDRSSVQFRPPSGWIAPASSRMITLVPELGETTIRDESAAGHALGSTRSKMEEIEKSSRRRPEVRFRGLGYYSVQWLT
jgi:hypothetical protein